MKQKLVLLIAAAVGLLAFATTYVYLKAEREKLYKNAEPVEVLVAASDLPAGTTLTAGNLSSRKVFKASVDRQVFKLSQKNLLIGKTLVYPVTQSSPIAWIHVGANLDELRNLSGLVPKNMRAISIPVSGETAVSGLVRPNDHVDILGTFTFNSKTNPGETETVTFTVLQDVTVLATGQETARTDLMGSSNRKRSSYSTITISAFPAEVELLAFAMNVKGSLTLSLRNPDDVSVMDTTPPIDFQKLQNELPRLNEKRQKLNKAKQLQR